MNGAAKAGLYDLKTGLLKTVEELHMNLTGASDCSSPSEMIKMRNAIMVAVNTWEPSHSFSKKYDDAVKALCQAVLDEAFELDRQALFVVS
jgi:hypothetical protein